MAGTVTDSGPKKPKGRPVDVSIAAAEGLVEAIVVVTDDARDFERIGQLAVQLARACFGRAKRLRDEAIPELERAYAIAESATYAGAETRAAAA